MPDLVRVRLLSGIEVCTDRKDRDPEQPSRAAVISRVVELLDPDAAHRVADAEVIAIGDVVVAKTMSMKANTSPNVW